MRINGYVLEQLDEIYFSKYDDESLMAIASIVLERICNRHGEQKPCGDHCPIANTIHCTGLARLTEKAIQMNKVQEECECGPRAAYHCETDEG